MPSVVQEMPNFVENFLVFHCIVQMENTKTHMPDHNFLQTYTNEDAYAYSEYIFLYHRQLHENDKILSAFHPPFLGHGVILMVATTSNMLLEKVPNTHIGL